MISADSFVRVFAPSGLTVKKFFGNSEEFSSAEVGA